MQEEEVTEKNSFCKMCGKRIPKRVTHLYDPALAGWLCQDCWDDENSD